MDKQVVWKSILGYPEYEVSEHGDVRRNGLALKPERVQGSGRKRFRLSKSGRASALHAAHLVALAFIGPKPFEGAEVCHNDGFEHNNHYSNLRWGSHASNMNDVTKHRFQRRVRSSLPLTSGERDAMAAAQFLASALR